MSRFDLAIPVVMAHEGTDAYPYCDDPVDPGGATIWGWSMLTIKKLGLTPRDLGLDQDQFTPGCLKAVSKQRCQELYKKYFWEDYGYGLIVDQNLATKIFDAAVNMGPKHAAEFAQKAANSLGAHLTVDGSLGPASVAAINALDGKAMLKAYADQMTAYYMAIIAHNPTLAKFQSNWLKRAQWGV